jgi:hypothetical protein
MSRFSNQPSEIALKKIFELIQSAKGQTSLKLADSFIGDEGCGMVAAFLRENDLV